MRVSRFRVVPSSQIFNRGFLIENPSGFFVKPANSQTQRRLSPRAGINHFNQASLIISNQTLISNSSCENLQASKLWSPKLTRCKLHGVRRDTDAHPEDSHRLSSRTPCENALNVSVRHSVTSWIEAASIESVIRTLYAPDATTNRQTLLLVNFVIRKFAII